MSVFQDVKIGEKDELIVNGHKIKCIQASREGPKALPWEGADLRRRVRNVGWGGDLHPKKTNGGQSFLLYENYQQKHKTSPIFFWRFFLLGKKLAPGITKNQFFDGGMFG